MDLKNKKVLITGGARIGVTVAETLSSHGADVLVSYRNSKNAAEKAVSLITKNGRKGFSFQCDVSNEKSVRDLVANCEKKLGGINVIINMASSYAEKDYDETTSQDWNKNLDANLKSAHLTVWYARELLKKSKGRVINICDWVAASGRPRYTGFVPYYTSKMGVLGLTQAQALELAPDVLVNAIAPGPILAPTNLTNEETQDVAKVTPLKKWGGAQEIAKAALFLCQTDFVTGECIRVDGGRHLF